MLNNTFWNSATGHAAHCNCDGTRVAWGLAWWNREGSITTLTISGLLPSSHQIICSYHPCEAVLPGCKILKHKRQNYEWLLIRYIRIHIYVDKHLKGTQNTKDNWWGKTVGNFSFFFFNCYICEINWKGGKNLIRATGEEVGELGKSPWRTKKYISITTALPFNLWLRWLKHSLKQ